MVTQHFIEKYIFCVKSILYQNVLLLMLLVVPPYLGQLFPELRTYSENNVETVTCPRSCSRDGDSVAFCIFDNATSVPRHLYSYLSENDLLVGEPGSDCDDRTSGNGTAFISFRVQPRMSGCTIYCVRRLRHCSSLINTLIPPLLINVEGMYVWFSYGYIHGCLA